MQLFINKFGLTFENTKAKMKLLYFALILILSAGFTSAQNYDSRLLKKFNHEELIFMEQNNPLKLKRYEYALDHGVYFAELPFGKKEDLPSISLNGDPTNFLELGIDIINKNQYFKIEGTDKMLVVKSIWVLDNEMRQ